MGRAPPTFRQRLTTAAAPERRAQATSAIYGTILVTAVIAALSEDPGAGPLELLAVVIDTSVVFTLAHVYAEHLGERAATTDRAEWRTFPTLLAQEVPMVIAATLPAIALALGAVHVLSRDAAVTVALTAGVAELFVWGFLAGLHERGPRQALWAGAGNAALGLLVVFLKVLVH